MTLSLKEYKNKRDKQPTPLTVFVRQFYSDVGVTNAASTS